MKTKNELIEKLRADLELHATLFASVHFDSRVRPIVNVHLVDVEPQPAIVDIVDRTALLTGVSNPAIDFDSFITNIITKINDDRTLWKCTRALNDFFRSKGISTFEALELVTYREMKKYPGVGTKSIHVFADALCDSAKRLCLPQFKGDWYVQAMRRNEHGRLYVDKK